MPEATEPRATSHEATLKARELEGVLDLYFYRRVGYWMARGFARLRLTPTGVTLLGGVFGLLAGHFYFYRDLRLNLIGMLLHICANAFDNADGQLARLTNTQSRRGRIIDSVVDHIIFINIYVHLALRCAQGGMSGGVWLLAGAAALSHALQASAADYSRNVFLFFVKERALGHFELSEQLLADYRQLKWRVAPLDKLLLGLYMRATRQQELLNPDLLRLQQTVVRQFSPAIPEWWQNRFRETFGPTFRLWGFLMTNTRMILLFAVLVLDHASWFFWAEVGVFNVFFAAVIYHQTQLARSLRGLATSGAETLSSCRVAN